MKKFKHLVSLGLAIAMGSAIGLTACGGNVTEEYALSCYRGENKDANGRTIYNTSLFYSNTVQQGYPDPQVLDDTAEGRTGYYYLYGTSGNFAAMRSKNLVEWEHVGTTFKRSEQGDKTADVTKITNECLWAPEVIYDEDTGLYYMFFSATPDAGYKPVAQADGVVANTNKFYNMYVATSDSPMGPFMVMDFSDEKMVGAENLHDFNTEAGLELSQAEVDSGEYAYVTVEGQYYEAAFPHYWANYCLFSPDELSKVFQKNGVGAMGGSSIKTPDASYFATIDPSPFVDPATKKKYLYFKAENSGWNINVVVEMENWLKPKWETAKYITHSNFYTLDDWRAGTNRGVSYESSDCNEGAFMLHHKDANGKDMYYFTFSVNDYSTSAYQVGMAVGTSPTGPFRKLTEAEGGLLLCSSTTDSDSVSGAGHHSFVTLGDQLYIAYHRHRDFIAGGSDRYTAVDEVKFITVSDIDGNEMEIPYVNGPTDSIQPLPEAYSGYKNVVPDATLTCSDSATKTEYAVDGLLSVHKTADEDFMDYIGESKITQTATFDFAFKKNTSIRAIMVYNSAFEKSVFYNISRIELTLADGSVRVIRDVKFDVDQYCTLGGQDGTSLRYIMSGSAAFAEFYDVEVKSVKITVDVPEKQQYVGISEIKILGKA